MRTYPALVDRGTSVDLALLESSGRRRGRDAGRRAPAPDPLGAPHARPSPRSRRAFPAPFARPNGAPPSRVESEAFRAMVLARIVDEAFRLGEDAPLPRTKRAFDELIAAGTPRVDAVVQALRGASIARAASELDDTLAALRSAAKHPGARIALAEIRAQLEQLFPADLVALGAARASRALPALPARRRGRGSNAPSPIPRKDAEKLATIAPLWAAFLAKQAAARDRASAQSLRWSFEELRVAVFAPELKTPVPVSLAKMAGALAALR